VRCEAGAVCNGTVTMAAVGQPAPRTEAKTR
jgi:hypothetical protein